LSSIPTRFKQPAAVDLGGLITLQEPGSIQAEAFRGLRTGLLLETSNIGARSILVTTADLDQGTTWVAANLAVALAASGKRVVLISADLRNPCLGPAFGTEPEASLYDVLARSEDLRDVVHRTSIEGLLLVEGRCSTGYDIRSQLAGAADLVDLISAGDVVREALNIADMVLVCSPSLAAHSESASWARACDGVLLVSDVRTTTHAATTSAIELLGRAHATIVGAVLLERGRRWRPSRTRTISEPAERPAVRTGPDLSIPRQVSASESGET
jgi:Mrp family chromosome partitioning ATPase